LPKLQFQYLDFAHWQRNWLTSREFAQPMAYWIRQLRPPLAELFPPVTGRNAALFAIRRRKEIVIPRSIVDAARRLARSAGCTQFSAMMTTLKLVLFARTGEADVRVGTTVANRGIPGSEEVVGFFANFVCLRTNIVPSLSFQELIKSVHNVIRDATENQELPFDVVTHALDVAFGIWRSSMYQVMLLWHAMPSETIQFPGLRLDHKHLSLTDEEAVLVPGSLEMIFELNETPAEVNGSVSYRQDRFDDSQIMQFLSDLSRCIILADQRPGITVAEVCDRLRQPQGDVLMMKGDRT